MYSNACTRRGERKSTPVRAAVEVDVHDGLCVGPAGGGQRALPVGQPKVAELAVRLPSVDNCTCQTEHVEDLYATIASYA